MINWIKEKIDRFGFTRYKRVLNYIANLKSSIKITSKHDKNIIAEIDELINDRVKRLEKSYTLLGFLYFAVYFSFFSLLFSDILIISELVSIFSTVISFFGTTVLIISIFFTNKVIELYYQDLNLLTAHLISIYNKASSNNTAELFDDMNEYNSFISFFKKRGF